jgi:hypothetical protein
MWLKDRRFHRRSKAGLLLRLMDCSSCPASNVSHHLICRPKSGFPKTCLDLGNSLQTWRCPTWCARPTLHKCSYPHRSVSCKLGRSRWSQTTFFQPTIGENAIFLSLLWQEWCRQLFWRRKTWRLTSSPTKRTFLITSLAGKSHSHKEF